MMRFRLNILLLIFLLFALAPAHADAAGRVSGSFLYGTGQYRAEVDGEEVQKVTSQYGQVGLRYGLQGMNPRLGKYTLMLGYEFNILDPTITNNGIKDPAVERIETGKVLYQGEVLVAPGGLPFRFSAYARDIKPSLFASGMEHFPDLPIGFQGGRRNQSQRTLLKPDIITDIDNGTHRDLGATLLVGIRNGSYLGNYRDVLSQLPRLLIDYKQSEVRDLARDSTQQHYRERDLAFISLNKKDNWVHYRTHDFKNYLDPTEDFETHQVLIGTVDQLLARQWINLTNWIKISGDLSYNVDKNKTDNVAENTYRVNLFANAQRQEFKSSILSSFERSTQGERITQEIDLPLYFNYAPHRDSYYRGSLRSNFYHQSAFEGIASESNQFERKSRDVTFDLGSELFRTGAILFKPRIMLGVRGDDNAQGLSEKLTLEWSSQRGKISLPWTAGYYLASTQTSTDTTSAVYLEQSLYGSIEKSLSRAVRVGFRATVRHGSGQSESDYVTDSVSGEVKIGATGEGVDRGNLDRFLLYDGRFFVEHAGKLFSNRLELIAEGINSDVKNLRSTEVRHELRADGRISKFSLSSTLSRGTNVKVQTTDQEYMSGQNTTDGTDLSWSSKAKYSYAPDRRMVLTLSGHINGFSGEAGNYNTWLGSEKLEYGFYKTNGIVRKIAEISEEFGFEGTTDKVAERNRITFLRVAGAVYPNRYLYARVATETILFSPGSSAQMTLNAETGLNFEKLQVAMSYGRGYKEAEGFLAKVEEERWDLKVRKTF